MSQQFDQYAGTQELRITAERAQFIMRTYLHLFGAIGLFTAIEVALFNSGLAEPIAQVMLRGNWLIVLGGFMVVSWLASHAAGSAKSLAVQYIALLGFVGAWSIIFVPLLFVANTYAPGAIDSAALITIMGFTGLTGIVVWTRKDFSFLGGILRWAFLVAILAIVGSLIFGFQMGTWFSVAMVGLAGAAILYDTSNVLRHFPEDRYVAASLQLFASVALMFWYVLQLVINRD
jgi:FtsH-binding integral membrane protein